MVASGETITLRGLFYAIIFATLTVWLTFGFYHGPINWVEVEYAETVDGIMYCQLGFKGGDYYIGRVISNCYLPVGRVYEDDFNVNMLFNIEEVDYRDYCHIVQHCGQYWP